MRVILAAPKGLPFDHADSLQISRNYKMTRLDALGGAFAAPPGAVPVGSLGFIGQVNLFHQPHTGVW